MESKAIPTVEEFISEYTDGDIDHLTGPYSLEITKELMQEYAVLFARYHVQECKEAIKDSVIDQAFKLGIKKQSVESLEYMAENAYDEDNIK